jgi:hypothetical protein
MLHASTASFRNRNWPAQRFTGANLQLKKICIVSASTTKNKQARARVYRVKQQQTVARGKGAPLSFGGAGDASQQAARLQPVV